MARYTTSNIVLLLGREKAWTPLPWEALERVPELLRDQAWMTIGRSYSTDALDGTLDAHLKSYMQRATAGWVAVVLERAGVVDIDRSRPARIRLSESWSSLEPRILGSPIDTAFDVRTDAGGKDPDSHSPTLRRYHQLLWGKPLPGGPPFHLDDKLHHVSELGDFWLRSDAITNTYVRWTRPARIARSSRKFRKPR